MTHTTQILDNALGAVGHTPLVRLDRIAKEEGLQCNLREYMLSLSALAALPYRSIQLGKSSIPLLAAPLRTALPNAWLKRLRRRGSSSRDRVSSLSQRPETLVRSCNTYA